MTSSRFKIKRRNAGTGALAAPTTVIAPTITGSSTLGGVLSIVSTGVYTGSPTSLNKQWMRNGVAISGANGDTYPTVIGDLTANITLQITPVNGVGTGSPTTSNAIGPITSAGTVGSLVVSAAYNGTAGSGWGGAYEAKPVDPLRLTAKPSLNPLWPQYQCTGADFHLEFEAEATGGIASVEVWAEGVKQTVTQKTTRTYTDCNGVSWSRVSYRVLLDNAACLAIHSGPIEIMARATANDTSMQQRVVGPFLLHVQSSANKYDHEVTVDASQATSGTRYQTVTAMLQAVAAANKDRCHVVFKTSGDYDMGSADPWGRSTATSFMVLECDAGVNVTIKGNNFYHATDNNKKSIRCGYDGMWFRGGGFTFDQDKCSQFYPEDSSNKALVLEGINIIKSGAGAGSSGSGPDSLQFGEGAGIWMRSTKSSSANRKLNLWALNCNLNAPEGFYSFMGVVDNTVTGCSSDLFQNCRVVVGNKVANFTAANLRAARLSMTISYSGSATTAVVTKANYNQPILLVENGATVATIATTAANPAGFSYTWKKSSDIVAAINAYGNGWSATLGDDLIAAAHLADLGNILGVKSVNQNVKAGPKSLYTGLDIHCDLWQNFPETNISMQYLPLIARTAGTAGNSIAMSKSAGYLTLSGSALTGGASGVRATGVVTFTNNSLQNLTDGDTFTLDGVTYTFKNTPVGTYDVKISSDYPYTLLGLAWAIQSTHPTVTVAFHEEVVIENRCFARNKVVDSEPPAWFFEGFYRDCTISDNLVEGSGASFVSQMSIWFDHLAILRNSLDKQTLFLRTPSFIATSYTAIMLNYLDDFGWMGGAETHMRIERNYVRKQSSAPAGTWTNCRFGGNAGQSTLFNGPSSNDFTPINNGNLKLTTNDYVGPYLPNGDFNPAY